MSKEEDVVELDEDISLLHSVFFEVNVANMIGESNIYPVEVSSRHQCSTSGGTFGREAGHSLDRPTTSITFTPWMRVLYAVLIFVFNPRLALVFRVLVRLPSSEASRSEIERLYGRKCTRAPKRYLLRSNMNSTLSLMTDREHLAHAEASIDPVLPNLNRWDWSRLIDSSPPIRAEPRASVNQMPFPASRLNFQHSF